MNSGYTGVSRYNCVVVPTKTLPNGILSVADLGRKQNISCDRAILENYFERFARLDRLPINGAGRCSKTPYHIIR